MYAVSWHDDAFRALQKLQERSHQVARAIFQVARTELINHFPPDGGSGAPPLLWRRGITEEERKRLDKTPRRPDSGERPWKYLLVYRPLENDERPERPDRREPLDGFLIIELVREDDVAAEYIDIISDARPTKLSGGETEGEPESPDPGRDEDDQQ